MMTSQFIEITHILHLLNFIHFISFTLIFLMFFTNFILFFKISKSSFHFNSLIYFVSSIIFRCINFNYLLILFRWRMSTITFFKNEFSLNDFLFLSIQTFQLFWNNDFHFSSQRIFREIIKDIDFAIWKKLTNHEFFFIRTFRHRLIFLIWYIFFQQNDSKCFF